MGTEVRIRTPSTADQGWRDRAIAAVRAGGRRRPARGAGHRLVERRRRDRVIVTS